MLKRLLLRRVPLLLVLFILIFPGASRAADSVPILMYHVIDDYSGVYEELYVSPSQFLQQMSYLKEQGYHTVTMQDVLSHWLNGNDLPEKPIVLSFDDGYRSMYINALPILREFGFVATLFLYTAKIDTEPGLTSDMVRELSGAGIEIGSHTVTHPDMTLISSKRLTTELKQSKSILEKLTGKPVVSFCYPAGRNNALVRRAVQQTGYLGAVTTKYGLSYAKDNKYRLNRIRINKSDSLERFIGKLKT